MKFPTHNPAKLFGVACPPEKASVVVIPVPWEVTVSSRSGTALGPESVLKASHELGSTTPHETPSAQELGIAMLPIPHDWKGLSDTLRHHTVGHIHAMESGFEKSTLKKSIIKKIDHYADQLREDIKHKAIFYLKEGKLVGVLGGDHSVPLGLIQALSEFHNNFGVLQIDAHPGLRKAYRGFHYSHASIMYNVLQLPYITRLVQVGLRNCAAEELQVIEAEEGRIFSFFDSDFKQQRFQGVTWEDICTTIVDTLPERIHISFDIDALDAKLCPSTGAPVPGGLEFDEVCYLLDRIAKSGKKIIGFDLCEIAPGENIDWDAQVGSRILYRLAKAMVASQGRPPLMAWSD
ncbi:MAG: agmatinase family protein [Bacteroidota bacterium]